MPKERTAYVCSACGYDSPKWIGRCPACGEWNTFSEVRLGPAPSASAARRTAASLTAAHAAGRGTLPSDKQHINPPVVVSHIPTTGETRIDLQDAELNRVLGGGLVPGSLTLLGGEPGIGKSTLVLQTILHLPALRVLYVSGEESARQIRLRADRLLELDTKTEGSVPTADSDGTNVFVACEAMIETVFEHVRQVVPQLIIIDSIQTLATESIDSSPGSVAQIRECAAMLLRLAKESGVPVILIGHINKEGTIAGPKILEHMVDTVLQFEGDRHHLYRILRAAKNRFGSTAELGIYEMQSSGLRPVANPSELLLGERPEGEALSGVAVASALEGVRPLLIETQALVATAAYGTPQRSATGFDTRRLNMLLAVLEKRVGFKLAQKDVYLNIAGGIRVSDPAIDLSVIAAVISSNVDMAIDARTCLCGEVGLSGELRPVSRILQRVAEAQRLGFTQIIIPQANAAAIDTARLTIRVTPVSKVEQAIRELMA